MSRPSEQGFSAIEAFDPMGLETLFPGVFDPVPPTPSKGSAVFVTDNEVTKTIFSPVNDEVPTEFHIQTIASLGGLSASLSGVMPLISLKKRVLDDSLSATWTATMSKCPVMLDHIFPLLKLMMDSVDLAENQLVQHVQFAVFASLVTMLETFQKANIVHCDLKPENIGLVADQNIAEHNGAQCAIDFGVSRQVGQQFTTPSGTIAYMAPELFGGESPASAKQDIYALGCVMRALEQGDMPAAFIGTSEGAIYWHFLQEMHRYDAVRVAELQKLSSMGNDIVQAELKRQQQFLQEISACTDFKACLLFVIESMCSALPEYRPILASLKMAEEQLQRLLPPLQSGYSVAGFFQCVIKKSLGHEVASPEKRERDSCLPRSS